MTEPNPKPESALAKRDPSSVEYVPYGSQDKIKLNIQIVQNLIAVKTKSGKTCSDRDAIKFLAMCQAKRLNPFEGDAFLIGYDGKDGPQFALITAHQTYLKRAELHPEFDGMRSGLIVREEEGLKDLEGDFFEEGQQVVGGWATVFFKNRKQPMHKRLRLARFQKGWGVWQEDPAGMICKCAEADALRSAFPTMLGGLYLREEIETPPLPNMVKPEFGPAPGRAALFEPARDLAGEYIPSQDEAQPEPEPAPQSPEPSAESKYLKSVRLLAKAAKLKEGELLDWLNTTGAADGASATLDELPVEVLQRVHDHWKEIITKINELKGTP